jgi:hypothetical protein
MWSLWQHTAAAIVFLTWLNAPPTSLADAARREAIRRQMTPKASRIYAIDDQTGLLASASTPPAGDQTGGDGKDPVTAAAAAGDETTPAKETAKEKEAAAKGDEQQWRDRVAQARDALARDQVLAESLQSRINALTNDMLNRDDPAYRAKLADDRQRVVTELARLQKQILADEKAITAIHDDARRKGVPPGWIR